MCIYKKCLDEGSGNDCLSNSGCCSQYSALKTFTLSCSFQIHILLINQVVLLFLMHVVRVVALVLRHILELKEVRVSIHDQDRVKNDLTNLSASKVVVVFDCGAGLVDAVDVHDKREGIETLLDIFVL